MIQVSEKLLQLLMWLTLEQVPVETLLTIPFIPLSYLGSHEEELFARVAVHEGKQRAEIGKFLPQVAGHFVQKRPLAVRDFVVRKNENEVLVKCIEEREGNQVLMVLSMNRIL